MTWKTARLEDVAQVLGGGTPSRTEKSYFGGHIPWVTPTDVTSLDGLYIGKAKESITDEGLKNSSTKLMPVGAVLLTSRATIGFTAVTELPMCTNQGFVNFICGEELVPEFLAYWLKTQKAKMIQHAGGTTFKEIARGTLRKFEIAFPSIPEQRRIVDILSRAEGIVRLRREAKQKAAKLIPALFLDMFGDPAMNPKGWPLASLGEHVEITSAVKTPDLNQDADLPCIGSDSIESHTGKLISLPTVRDVQPISGKYRFKFGDVLYSKIRPYLAKASLAPCEGYCSADMYPLSCKPTLLADFLLALLLSKSFTVYATAESVRAQMPKLNRQTLFTYQFPVPPIKLQEQFSDHAGVINSIQFQQLAATVTAQATFDALLAHVFN